MLKISRIKKNDIPVLKKNWKVENPFVKRYESQKKSKSNFFIIWKNKTPIGHGQIIWEKIPILEDMFVEKKFRSKGIGKVLLKKLESSAKRKGFKKIKLYVGIKNKKAQNFYIKNNYSFTGRTVKKEKEMEKKL